MSYQDFINGANQKFIAGAREHKRPWSKETINVESEVQGECYDLYWYLDFEEKEFQDKWRQTIYELWQIMEDRKHATS